MGDEAAQGHEQLAQGDPEIVLATRGLAKVYGSGPSAVHALGGVDLELRRREFIVLLGRSGSGKSTLLNIMGGLDLPSGGEILFRDAELRALDDRR